jgi:hypothetical protein
MPSARHQAIVELLRERPSLAVELLRGPGGVRVPSAARVATVERTFSEMHPPEYSADLVLQLSRGRFRLACVVEAQLRGGQRVQRDKLSAWPRYAATLWAELGSQVCILVVTASRAVERWAGGTIHMGPGFSLTPIVLGPSTVPIVLELAEGRRRPELAVLSAVAHGRGRDAERVGKTAVAASLAVAAERRKLYIDLVLASLGRAARQAVEQMMTQNYQYQSELFRRLVKQGLDKGRKAGLDEGRKEGVAEAKAADVLRVLRARGVRVPKRAEARISKCRDTRTLDRWITRAVRVSRASELFE